MLSSTTTRSAWRRARQTAPSRCMMCRQTHQPSWQSLEGETLCSCFFWSVCCCAFLQLTTKCVCSLSLVAGTLGQSGRLHGRIPSLECCWHPVATIARSLSTKSRLRTRGPLSTTTVITSHQVHTTARLALHVPTHWQPLAHRGLLVRCDVC